MLPAFRVPERRDRVTARSPFALQIDYFAVRPLLIYVYGDGEKAWRAKAVSLLSPPWAETGRCGSVLLGPTPTNSRESRKSMTFMPGALGEALARP